VSIPVTIKGGYTPVASIPSIPAGSGPITFAFTSIATLQAIVTVGLTLNCGLLGTFGGGSAQVQLISGNQTTGGGYIRPNDYNASTNAVVWVQIGG
jgi:hypothetical protein